MCLVIFWGTFFPLISEALTGHEALRRPAEVRPLDGAAGAPARAALRPRAGDRVAARDGRATCAATCSCRRWPRVAVLAVAGRARRSRASRRALLMFALAAFVLGRGRPGVLARRARAAGDGRRAACRPRSCRWCAATAAATAATSSTPASRCCSSASRRRRASRTSATCCSARARRARVGGYEVTYVRADRRARGRARTARLERIDLGAGAARARATASRSRRCAPSVATSPRRPGARPGVALLRGRGDQRGRPAGRLAARRLDGDRARHRRLRAADRGGRRGVRRADDDLAAGSSATRSSAQALDGLARSYADDPPPATFRLIVSPLVTWIWLGALIVFAGGLIALWPPPRGAPRPARGRLRGARRARGAHRRLARLSGPPASCSSSLAVVVAAGHRAAAPAAARARPPRTPSAPSSRPRARPSTARSATPSSTTAPASSPRRTGARSTARCAPRRSRSCTASTSWTS